MIDNYVSVNNFVEVILRLCYIAFIQIEINKNAVGMGMQSQAHKASAGQAD